MFVCAAVDTFGSDFFPCRSFHMFFCCFLASFVSSAWRSWRSQPEFSCNKEAVNTLTLDFLLLDTIRINFVIFFFFQKNPNSVRKNNSRTGCESSVLPVKLRQMNMSHSMHLHVTISDSAVGNPMHRSFFFPSWFLIHFQNICKFGHQLAFH